MRFNVPYCDISTREDWCQFAMGGYCSISIGVYCLMLIQVLSSAVSIMLSKVCIEHSTHYVHGKITMLYLAALVRHCRYYFLFI